MDLEKSLAILSERAQQPSNFILSSSSDGNPLVSLNSTPSIESAELASKNNLELLNIALEYQEKRVDLYKLFDEGLNELVADNALEGYPSLCSTVTQKFSYYSSCIIVLKNLFNSRDVRDVASTISSIQEQEKEKLTLFAAKHLDIIQDHVGSFNSVTGGKSKQQQEYLSAQIQKVEQRISELVEELICYKVDLID